MDLGEGVGVVGGVVVEGGSGWIGGKGGLIWLDGGGWGVEVGGSGESGWIGGRGRSGRRGEGNIRERGVGGWGAACNSCPFPEWD